MGFPFPPPIAVSTSQVWDYDGGGIWSTFILNIGTPPQPSRVVISTSGSEAWLVGPEGCPQKYGNDCQENRGLLFTPDKSTSWTANKNFSLFLEEELGYRGNGQFGFDTIKLGYTGSGGIVLEQQTVAAIASPDYWLGLFGLDPAPSNFTNMNEPYPSFLTNCFSRNLIPSLSWGYTAGAIYRMHKPQGSLTLGGYDNGRFASPNLTFQMYDDVSRRLIVDLQSITNTISSSTGISTLTTSTELMSTPISLAIDSTVPHLHLPLDLCQRFEEAFGVVWVPSSNTYVLNETAHPLLQQSKPNITFTLADPQGNTLNITFPYSAFNATIRKNTTSPGSLSFPLKRAMNDTQYTLGRTFLQEAYLIADYHRSTFTIASCTWPPTLKQDIKAILPPTIPDSKPPSLVLPPKSSYSHGLIPAIIIPILFSILLLLYFYIRHRKKQQKSLMVSSAVTTITEDTQSDELSRPELDTTCVEILEIEETEFRAEIEGNELQRELDSGEIHEMPPEGLWI